MKLKPRLSFWQIWNMSFGFFGIQFGFGLQNGNVSRIFQTLGADVGDIPILWIAAPVTGLIIQPIIGYFSDHTWTKFGRRRPYFLFGAIAASVALIFMPQSPTLWISAGMLWIMDASINITMEPFRAFVGDMLPEEQRTMGFTMQSFFIGLGGFVASWMPYVFDNWFHISNTAPDGVIPNTVKFSFYLGGIVFLLAVLWTVFTTREYNPDQMQEFNSDDHHSYEESIVHYEAKKYFRRTIGWLIPSIIVAYIIYTYKLEQELYIIAAGLGLFALLQFVSGLFTQNKMSNGLTEVISDLYRMPETMKRLAAVQFFSWFALFSMWIYTTSGVTSHIIGTTDTQSEAYNQASNIVSGMFGWYNLFAAAFGLLLLPYLARLTNRKITHFISLFLGGISLISIFYLKDIEHMIYPMIGIGLAWASILSMPYALLTSSIPQHKMGIYMGIFNFFIVIPQILASSILGFMVVHLFKGQSILALVAGGISMIFAGFLVFLIKDNKK